MHDIALEVVRAVVLAVLVVWLTRHGNGHIEGSKNSWNLIIVGFSLLLFGSVLDISDNYPELNYLVVVGDTEVESFLEKFVGFLGGFLCIAIGLMRWLPSIEKAEKAMQTAVQRMQEAQRLGKLGSWSINHQNHPQTLTCSDETYRIFEVVKRASDVTYDVIYQRVHPDDLDRLNTIFEAAVKNKQPYQLTYRIVMDDGRVKFIREAGDTKYSEDGLPLLSTGTIQDITEITGLDQKYQVFKDASRDGIHILDELGNVVECSPSFAHMLGYTLDEAMQLNVADWDASISPEELPSIVQQLIHSSDIFETVHRRKNGSTFHVEVSAWGVTLGGKEYLYASSRDITDRIVAEEERIKAHQAKDEFLASMSHELRTPLTSIIGNTEFLKEQLTDPDQQELVHLINSASQTQLALVNDILDMSKIDSGKFTIDEHPYDLNLLMKEIESMFSLRAKDAGLVFTVEQDNQESFELIGDSRRITQVLTNLLSNAIKFTEWGEIRLYSNVKDNYLVFQVEDTGVGMTVEEQSCIFRKFEQADGGISRRFGGTGLGLYISFNLAHMMGGKITATSEKGAGSTFTVTLPYRLSDIPCKNGQNNHIKKATRVDSYSGHVLVAEDTPELQMLERRILEGMGLKVTTADDGMQVLEKVVWDEFDLVFMDMQMPNLDGIETTRMLREQGYTVPIIALTANVMQKHRDAFHAAGCNEFLGKPIDKNQLRAILDEYLVTQSESKNAVAMPEIDGELMSVFKDSVADYYLRMEAALNQGENQELRTIAHNLKGSAASFGYSDISKQAEIVQLAIDQGNLDSAYRQAKLLLALMSKLG